MRSKRAHITRLDRDTDGIATLELAVLLPFLLALGFGVFEFGNLIYQYHLIVTGVRDAARYLSGLEPNVNQDAWAKNIAVTGERSGGTLRIPWWSADRVSVNYSIPIPNNDGLGNKLYRGGDYIQTVTVSTSVPYQALGFLEFLGLRPITLTASHEERLYQVR